MDPSTLIWYLKFWRVDPVVAYSSADRLVPGSNPTLAKLKYVEARLDKV